MPSEAPSAQPAGRLVIERPPEGLARGEHASPPWAIGLLGGAVVAAAVLYLWRTRRSST